MPKRSKVPPSPDRVDALCQPYFEKKASIETMKEELEQLATPILQLAKRFGQLRGEKSKALLGEIFEAVRTDGHSTSIDTDAVIALRSRLKAAGASHLFKKLFVPKHSFALAPGYETVLKDAKKAARKGMAGPGNLPTLFYNAVDITAKSPALKVDKLVKDKGVKAKKATASA